MNREKYTQGSAFPNYREDWVGRVTYNYDGRYLFETNGAYNGSEKFAPKYRFGFFPSVALGWLASNEDFLKRDWLNKLKIRYSIGKVGNDNFNSPRWAYTTNWALAPSSDKTVFGSTFKTSPYSQYYQSVVGNPDLQWEVSKKQNLGFEVSVLKNKFNLNVDVYRDNRSKIFMSNTQRQIPNYFGAAAVAANLGKTESKGYEIEFKYQSPLNKPFTYWGSLAYTHAMDKIIYREDPILLSDYQKVEGKQIDQTTSQLGQGILNNWDEVYMSAGKTGNNQKLPGDYNLVDFNGDGIMNNYDIVPNSFPERPQNTYTLALGSEYKGFSIMVQFYGVYNVSRTYGYYMYGFSDETKTVVFENMLDTWRPWNTDGSWTGQRLVSTGDNANRLTVDGSFLRLKNAEVAYTFRGKTMDKLGISSTRVYLNGNNLLYWSKMMDDRETNNIKNGAVYPMFRTVTFGLNINF
jgi:TonB-linked SusC/RagA family outer membrane protein